MKHPAFWRAFVLALSILFAQQLMLAHAVEHAVELGHSHGEPVEIPCHDCLALNHLPDAPSGKNAIPPVLDGAACQVAGFLALQVRGAACLAYSIRAPPVLPKSA